METPRERFERVAEPRIKSANKALELLQNLGRAEYDATVERKEEILEGFVNRIVALVVAWNLDETRGAVQRLAKTISTPETTHINAAVDALEMVGIAREAEGGADVESEIRWAIDSIARGDYELATNRLRRCLGYPEKKGDA